MKGIDITNYTICGSCSNCGQCCSDVLHLSKEEIKKIDEYMKENKVFRQKRGIEGKNFDMQCPFRDEFLHRCQIYPVRPEICKIFKCDKSPQQALKEREFTNFNKKPRSMSAIFFNDENKIKEYKEILGIRIYGRLKDE